jgi:hypothetical protein
LLAAFTVTHYDLARVFLRRYLIAFAIGPPLLTALLLTRLPRAALQGVVAAALVSVAIWHSNIVPQLRYDGRAIGERNEDWRSAFAWLREQHPLSPAPIEVYSSLLEDDPAIQRRILESGYTDEQLHEYLRFPLHSLYASPTGARHNPIQEAWPQLKWLVSRGEDRGMSCLLGRYDLATRNCDLVKQRSFGAVHVSLWQRIPADGSPPATSPQTQPSGP